jgi:hypothetical protein
LSSDEEWETGDGRGLFVSKKKKRNPEFLILLKEKKTPPK